MLRHQALRQIVQQIGVEGRADIVQLRALLHQHRLKQQLIGSIGPGIGKISRRLSVHKNGHVGNALSLQPLGQGHFLHHLGNDAVILLVVKVPAAQVIKIQRLPFRQCIGEIALNRLHRLLRGPRPPHRCPGILRQIQAKQVEPVVVLRHIELSMAVTESTGPI